METTKSKLSQMVEDLDNVRNDDKSFSIGEGIQINDLLKEVFEERKRQFAKFGYQNCTPLEWFAILSEEVGEVAKEVVDFHMAGLNLTPEGSKDYRKELLQVAAVALQAIQVLDDQVEREHGVNQSTAA